CEEPVSRPVVQHFTIGEISPVDTPSNAFRFSTLRWPRNCVGAWRGSMLKVRRTEDRDALFTVSGRLQADNVVELSALLAAEAAGRASRCAASSGKPRS